MVFQSSVLLNLIKSKLYFSKVQALPNRKYQGGNLTPLYLLNKFWFSLFLAKKKKKKRKKKKQEKEKEKNFILIEICFLKIST